MNKKRRSFLILFLTVLFAEVFIGIFVHDRFLRPYGGDVLVVVLIYAFVRIFFPVKPRLLSPCVFLFSVAAEILQGMGLADKLGLRSPLLCTVLGSTFDPADILCYAAGCILIHFIFEKHKTSEVSHAGSF